MNNRQPAYLDVLRNGSPHRLRGVFFMKNTYQTENYPDKNKRYMWCFFESSEDNNSIMYGYTKIYNTEQEAISDAKRYGVVILGDNDV